MRSQFANALGVPVEEVLNGVKVKLSLLTLGDLAEFERWVEGKAFRLLADNLDDIDDSKLSEQIISQALNKIMRPTEDESSEFDKHVGKEMTKPSGMQYLLWLSIRKKDPEITMEEVGCLITLNNLEKIGFVLDRISGLGGNDSDENPPKKKKAKSRAGSDS